MPSTCNMYGFATCYISHINGKPNAFMRFLGQLWGTVRQRRSIGHARLNHVETRRLAMPRLWQVIVEAFVHIAVGKMRYASYFKINRVCLLVLSIPESSSHRPVRMPPPWKLQARPSRRHDPCCFVPSGVSGESHLCVAGGISVDI